MVRSLRIILATVCVMLVMLSGAVQAVHSHADSAGIHADCSLCVTAHVTVQLAEAPAPLPVAHVFAQVELLPPAELPASSSAFSNFTRPPPSLRMLPA